MPIILKVVIVIFSISVVIIGIAGIIDLLNFKGKSLNEVVFQLGLSIILLSMVILFSWLTYGIISGTL